MSSAALSPITRCIRFCDCQVDLCTGEVHRDGSRIPLQRQPFKVLSALLERPGDLVTRAELHRKIWPDEVHLDFEHSLNRSVNKLRIALGDSADEPRIIETLPCRGYRFIAPIAVERASRAQRPRLLEMPAAREVGARRSATAPHGALPVDSLFYIERTLEPRVHKAVSDGESVVLLKGARETGKTSLLARVVDRARRSGASVVVTDVQRFNSADLASVDVFFRSLALQISESLQLDHDPEAEWDPRRGPSWNFDRFMTEVVLARKERVLWAIDEADRLFTYPYASEFFGLLRAWHNKRALDAAAGCHRLSVAIAYATEAHLLISDCLQSPFNLGSRFVVPDLSPAEVGELNRRYCSALDSDELQQLQHWLGGHPHLTHSALFNMANLEVSYSELVAAAATEDGPFADHLRPILVYLERSPELLASVCGLLQGSQAMSADCFYRLRAAGIIRGEAARDATFRCGLYRDYLGRHLL